MLTLRMRWGDLICSLAALCASADAGGGGSARVPRLYLDSVNRDQQNVQAVVEMDPVSFAVNTVGNKYKLVSLVLKNDAGTTLVLSAVRDRVMVVTDSGEIVRSSLQFAKLDRAIWDSWGNDIHERIEYPQSIPPHSSTTIYVFVPIEKLARVPEGVDITIDSLGKTLTLRKPPATAP